MQSIMSEEEGDLYQCYGCGKYKECREYSKSQMRKGDKGKCKRCIKLRNINQQNQHDDHIPNETIFTQT